MEAEFEYTFPMTQEDFLDLVNTLQNHICKITPLNGYMSGREFHTRPRQVHLLPPLEDVEDGSTTDESCVINDRHDFDRITITLDQHIDTTKIMIEPIIRDVHYAPVSPHGLIGAN